MSQDNRHNQLSGFSGELQAFGTRNPADRNVWREFVNLDHQILLVIREDLLALRRHWQPGDIKFALQKLDGDLQLDEQMPGFIPWLPGLELRKDQYPQLFDKIGNFEPASNETDETFKLPDHNNGYVRIGAQSDSPGNRVNTLSTGADYDGVIVSAWIKT